MDPLYEPVPERLTTPRLIVRCLRGSDGPAVNAAIVESLAELSPFMPWAQSAPTLAQSEAECRRMQAKFLLRQDLPMGLFERRADGGEGEYIGGSGLHRMDWTVRRFEIGYWCRTSRVGQGYIGEAVRAMTALVFGELRGRRAELRMDDDNVRSWRVAERAGYTLEGILRRDSLTPQGMPRDTRVYAITQPPAAA